uniref:Uncharacterized protein n=1 Tax=Siphoviridae sp. ctnpt50 TaxID=2827941 RepID=A0A8S5SEG6_9CAUD|nr:MAG TPA: hypothetical protein [Siphoviridae sp. ctnpt50]
MAPKRRDGGKREMILVLVMCLFLLEDLKRK